MDIALRLSSSTHPSSSLLEGTEMLGSSTNESSDDSSNEDDDDLSILDYARRHGLCKDYTSENPLSLFQQTLKKPAPETILDHLRDLEGMSHLPTAFEFTEKFEVDQDTAAILKFILCEPGLPSIYDGIEYSDSSARMDAAFLKLDLPLLKTDPELDQLRFCRVSAPDLRRLVLPFEDVDQERNEGYDWPRSMLNLPRRVEIELAKEKLAVPRETIGYLANLMRHAFSVEDEEETLREVLRYRKGSALSPITPPLLPLDPEPACTGGSLSNLDLELLSEVTDPTEAQVLALQKHMDKEDPIWPQGLAAPPTDGPIQLDNSSDMAMIYSPLRSIMNLSSTPPQKRKLSDLKVEVPLSPTATSSPSKKKRSMSVPDILREFIPSAPRWENPGSGLGSEESGTVFESLRQLSDKAIRALEQEQLKAADSIMRVPVPVMDFPPSQPPWKVYAHSRNKATVEDETELVAQKRLIQRLRREELSMYGPWRLSSGLERKLPWRPFPGNLGRVALDEQISDMKYLAAVLEDMTMSDVVSSEDLRWKQDGLRILDELEESEEELELGEFEQGEENVEFLVRKRKVDLIHEGQLSPEKEAEQLCVSGALDPRAPRVGRRLSGPWNFKCLNPLVEETVSDSNMGSLLGNGHFSASNNLDRFMILGGENRFKKPKLTNATNETPQTQEINQLSKATELPQLQAQDVEDPLFQPLVLPSLPSEPLQRTFIISVSILQSRRSLFRQIESFYSTAVFIERDFSALSGTPAYIDPPNQLTRAVRFDPCAEADIILSPSTGLVLTTLQKIQQRTLPGQGPQLNPFHERLRQIAVRYSRVVVLVSQAFEPTSKPSAASRHVLPPSITTAEPAAPTGAAPSITERDTLALATLHAFAATLPTEIVLQFVPGGERELAAWTALQMNVLGAQVAIEPLETQWEQFLRRAGLNAFAAQAVLVALRLPDSALGEVDDARSSSRTAIGDGPPDGGACVGDGVFGLRAFVRMSAGQRIARFEGLLGGRRVLERVNRCLERAWISESTGFR